MQLDALFVRCLHITHVCPRHMCAVVERGWEGSEGGGSACVYVCVCARDVRCFCSGLFGILLLARGLCYTFLINYKLLQIYLQAGITFIPPHFPPPHHHFSRSSLHACLHIASSAQLPNVCSTLTPLLLATTCVLLQCVPGNFVFSA